VASTGCVGKVAVHGGDVGGSAGRGATTGATTSGGAFGLRTNMRLISDRFFGTCCTTIGLRMTTSHDVGRGLGRLKPHPPISPSIVSSIHR
jgi:hypothetical protein